MYSRNRKKRTFFSPGTVERAKKRREESTDNKEEDREDNLNINQEETEDKQVESEKMGKEKLSGSGGIGAAATTTTTAANPLNKSTDKTTPLPTPTTSSTPTDGEKDKPKTPNDNKNKKFKSMRKDGEKDKRERGSDDEDHRALKRKSKKVIKQEDDDKGSDYEEGYGSSGWGSEMEEGNESGNDSGDESPSNEYHLARDHFNPFEKDSTSGDEQDGEGDEAEAAKRASDPNNPDNTAMAIDTNTDSLAKTSSDSSESNTNTTALNSTNATKDKSTNGLQPDKFKKRDGPNLPKTNLTKAKAPNKPPTPTSLSTIPSPESLTPEYFKSVLDAMKSDMARLNYRLEETTNSYNTRLREYEDKYVPRAVYTVLQDEVAYLKQQLQTQSISHVDTQSGSGYEKLKHDMVFVRSSLEETNAEVRQWRMAMDVDLTDKEDRLTQLSLRLDDIERNQQALIIRYPQLMQPAAATPAGTTPAHSPTPTERLSSSSSGTSNWPSGTSDKPPTPSNTSKSSTINSMQKEREKHSQGPHSQRIMLPPDIPSKYPPAAPSSPQQSPATPSTPSSSLLSSFDSGNPPFIAEPGWQPPIYGRQFSSGSSSNYYPSSGGYNKPTTPSGKGHHMPPHSSTHERGHYPHERHSNTHGSHGAPHHDSRDRMQYERMERERMQHDRLPDKSSRPW